MQALAQELRLNDKKQKMTAANNIKSTRPQRRAAQKNTTKTGEEWWKNAIREFFKKFSWRLLIRAKAHWEETIKQVKRKLIAFSILVMSFIFLMVGGAMFLESVFPNPPFPRGIGFILSGSILGFLGLILNLDRKS